MKGKLKRSKSNTNVKEKGIYEWLEVSLKELKILCNITTLCNSAL